MIEQNNRLLSEMPIVDRESLVEELATRIEVALDSVGELPGSSAVDVLGEMTGEPKSNIRLALARVAIEFLPGGNVALASSSGL